MSIKIYNAENVLIASDAIQLTAGILEQSKGALCIKMLVPVKDVVAVWNPSLLSMPAAKLPWISQFDCGANVAYPMFVFLNKNFHTSCAVALTNVVDDCHCSAKMNQELCSYEVTFKIAVTPETEPFEIFFNDTVLPMADTMKLYRDKIMPIVPEYPAGAWDAVYCSWYAVHAAVTVEYLRSNAKTAAELGFGTFIVDDGWCFDESKRVSPDTLPDWYRDIGDWQLSEAKLPKMKEVVEEAQKLGLNYMFWVAPFFSGRRSELNKKVEHFLTELHEGQRIIDPEDKVLSASVIESLLNVFKKMDLDGLKIDFLDTVLPNAKNPRCRLAHRYIKELVGRIRAVKPDALIEFRQNYATAINAPLATAFRAGDVPFDYMENFSRCVQIRLHMGDGIPVHADPVYFNGAESVEAVGRHMIASLAGVPMLSMEMSSIAPEHKKVIANYIKFYNQHRELLNKGHWSFEFRNGTTAFAKCALADETFIILADEIFAEKAQCDCKGKIFVLNMSGEEFAANGEIFDAGGSLVDGGIVPSGGRVELLK
jgi:alpha-galactosidase